MEKLILIDGNSLFNRAYYATPTSFTNAEGVPTNAIFGFTTMLFKTFTDLKPTRLAIAFDLKAPTFRHKLYKDYKATRKGMPDDLVVQVPLIKKMLRAMDIMILEKEGFEADDILGTIAKKYDGETIILTGDNDYLQLIDDSTTIYLTKKGLSEIDIKNEQTLKDSHNLSPAQIIDLKALMGDASDNIPGVKGVGEKTATDLLAKYQTLDGVYEHVDEIKGKLQEKLISDKENAYLSYTLATIETNAPIDFDIDQAVVKLPFSHKVVDVFKEYSFNSLLKRTEFFSDDSLSLEKIETVENFDIKTVEAFEKIIQENANEKLLAIDFSTNSFAFEKTKGYRVAIIENLLAEGISFDDYIILLKKLIAGKTLCLYDIKSSMHEMKKYDIDLSHAEFDLMLMHYLVDFDSSISSLLAILNVYSLDVGNSASGMLQLLDTFKVELDRLEMTKLYYDIELPLVNVLYEMESEGFKIDVDAIDDLRKSYQLEISSLTDKIHELAGDDKFNINSPKQLGEILFEKLQLPFAKKNKSGYSTDASILEKLIDKHEIISYILRYRQISKLLSTYIEGLSSQIDSKTNKIHTIFNQALTVTGRLSSKEPNLQNIPVRSEEGRLLRKIFIPSTKDNIIISADYSQIELRLLAHFSADESLIKAYKNGADIHRITASQVFNVPLDEVTSEMRSASKAVNFGIIYGISDFGLAQQIGVMTKTAKAYIEKYFEKYPTVKSYMNSNVEFCKANGYVSTITGRRRKIREINSQNFVQRMFGERAAMNMPLQGSSADIIKIAMINVFERLKKEKLQSKLILQIHDELLVDAKKNEQEEVIKILKEEMENAVSLNVPLTVNVSVGQSWYEAK